MKSMAGLVKKTIAQNPNIVIPVPAAAVGYVSLEEKKILTQQHILTDTSCLREMLNEKLLI